MLLLYINNKYETDIDVFIIIFNPDLYSCVTVVFLHFIVEYYG